MFFQLISYFGMCLVPISAGVVVCYSSRTIDVVKISLVIINRNTYFGHRLNASLIKK